MNYSGRKKNKNENETYVWNKSNVMWYSEISGTEKGVNNGDVMSKG